MSLAASAASKAPNFPGYGTASNHIKSVRMSVEEFFELPEYSCSVPTVDGNIPGGSMWFKPDGRFPVKMWRVDLDFRHRHPFARRAKFDPARWRVRWYEIDVADPGWKYTKTAEVEFTTTLTKRQIARAEQRRLRK